MSQTLIEKIAQRYAVGLASDQEVHSGDYISIKPAYVMTHDNTGAVIPKFKSIGATKLADARQVVYTLDHNVQDKSEKNLKKYRTIEAFSIEMGADFYPAGRATWSGMGTHRSTKSSSTRSHSNKRRSRTRRAAPHGSVERSTPCPGPTGGSLRLADSRPSRCQLTTSLSGTPR